MTAKASSILPRAQKVSRDPNQAVRLVESAYFPHTLRVLGELGKFELRLQAAELGPVTVGAVHWGTDISVESSYPNAYTINIPLSGRLVSSHQKETIISRAGLATVCSPDQYATMDLWSTDCIGIGLKIDRDYFIRRYRHITGTDEAVVLPRQLDLSIRRWRGWINLLRTVCGQSLDGADLLSTQDMSTRLSGIITDSLIVGIHPNDMRTKETPLRPRQITRVIDALHAAPAKPWSLSEMAELAEVSGRRLQQSFRHSTGFSPIEYLRELRLEGVHDDLIKSEDGALIREIAQKWGFAHMGRFSMAYKKKYGIPPSVTLREAR